MPIYRSKLPPQVRNMAGARALWRATGMTDADFQNPSSPLPIPLPICSGACAS